MNLAALGEISILLLNVTPPPSNCLPKQFSSNGQEITTPESHTYKVGNCTFAFVRGDGRDLSRFADREFDVVFSQSTLAYAGSYADQCRMACEIKRVGKRYFVQTPNKRFPLDWRTLVPFFHYLPARQQAWAFRHFRVDSDRAAHLLSIRDLAYPELASLFPHATLMPERVLGLTKSWMVHSGFDTAETA
jgi:hypothetical protein